jgi:hypothetical protein
MTSDSNRKSSKCFVAVRFQSAYLLECRKCLPEGLSPQKMSSTMLYRSSILSTSLYSCLGSCLSSKTQTQKITLSILSKPTPFLY